jgi:hypothetical protein
LTKTFLQQKQPNIKQGLTVKRKALAIVLVAIIALALASWFVHSQFSALQNQISELQAQNKDLQEQLDARKVMITEFSSRGWWNPVGVTMAVDFKIKILNTGTSDVEGATLGIKRFGFDSDPFNITKTLGILLAGKQLRLKSPSSLAWTDILTSFTTAAS